MLKRIKLFVNNNDESKKNSFIIANKFNNNGFTVVDKGYDLAIAVGGDGSFLRMVKSNEFNSNISYVGINSGHLGFLQEVTMNDLDEFIDELISNKYRTGEVSIQESNIYSNGKRDKYLSLNEIVIKDILGKVVDLNVCINNDLLEIYKGDGLLIATTLGSTAQNLGYGGSIVFNTLPTLQITSMAPINSKSYRSLLNSVIIPEGNEIIITPVNNKNNYGIIIDGEFNNYNNVEKISTKLSDNKIKCLRFSHYNYAQKIQDKLLS